MGFDVMIYLKKIRMMLLRPASFFDSVKMEEDYMPALQHLALIFVPAAVAVLLSAKSSPLGNFVLAIAEIVGNVIWFTFMITGLVHLGIYMMGSRKGVLNTYRTIAYGITPFALLSLIPFAGILGILWAIYLVSLGLSRLHGISMGKALLALFIVPLSVLLVATLLFTASLMGFFEIIVAAIGSGTPISITSIVTGAFR